MEKKIFYLQEQINLIETIKPLKSCPEFKKWKRDTEVVIRNLFGENSRHLKEFQRIMFGRYNLIHSTTQREQEQAFEKGMNEAEVILLSMKDEVEKFHINKEENINKCDALEKVEKICDRFHLVAEQLQNRYDNRAIFEIQDEYDVQDLLHALLKIEFDNIKKEEQTQSFAGQSSRVDFLLPKERIMIEVKYIKQKPTAKAF